MGNPSNRPLAYPGLAFQSPFTQAEAESLEIRILDILSRSSLADIPWPLIQADQVFALLRGERVIPTRVQLRLALAAGHSPQMSLAVRAARARQRSA